MDSDFSEDDWDSVFTLFFRPRLLLQGIVEYALAWSFTRGWGRLLLVHSLPILLLLSSVALVGYGISLSNRTLVERYDQWVADELPDELNRLSDSVPPAGVPVSKEVPPAADADSSPSPDSQAQDGTAPKATNQAQDQAEEKSEAEDQTVEPYGELLLRRLLKLQNSNSRISYLVAAQLVRQDRIGQARQMMRRIASEERGGFPPAHAWLAVDQLQSQTSFSEAERKRLAKDLAIATQWSGCPPGLFNLYAEMLERQGNTVEALAVLENAGAKEPSVLALLKIAELAVKHGQFGRFQRAADEIKSIIARRQAKQTTTPQDYAVLSNLALLAQEPKQAREIAMEGLRSVPQDVQLLRFLSESYRLEYLLSVRTEKGQTSVDLQLLDAALKADPTNPGVGEEIARLINVGRNAPPELQAALERQLAAGQASALTHILLANRALTANDLVGAEPHLELALRQAPGSPTIMNNLALVLARTKPSEMERARQLALTACRNAPSSGDFRDTLGEILLLSGDKLGAVDSYEAAVALNPNLISTREKLIQLYAELGMKEMAQAQQREIDQRAEQQQQQQQQQQQPSSEVDSTEKDKP